MKKKILILGVVLVVLLFLIYKIVLLERYKTDGVMEGYKKFIELYESKKIVNVESSKLTDNIITLRKINFKNIIGDYKITSNKLYDTYRTYSGDNGTINVTYMGSICKSLLLNSKVDDDLEKWCKKKGLTNNLEFLDYMYENRNEKVGVFSSRKTILENYVFINTLNNIIPTFYRKMTILKGDLRGYIMETGKMVEINVLKGSSMYLIAMEKKNYSEDFLSSIYFSDKEKYNCDFKRTFKVIDIHESNDEEYMYVTIRAFQGEDVQTIKIPKVLGKTMEKGNNYEFKYRQIEKIPSDSILDIYNHSELLFIEKTDLEGMGQVQESYCN